MPGGREARPAHQPMAEKPTVNDARYIMKSGLAGEKVPYVKPYSTYSNVGDLENALGKVPGSLYAYGKSRYTKLMGQPIKNKYGKEVAVRARQMLEEGIDTDDVQKVITANWLLENTLSLNQPGKSTLSPLWRVLNEKSLGDPLKFDYLFDFDKMRTYNPETYYRVRRLAEMYDSRTQDWNKIISDQKCLDEHPEVVAEAARKTEEDALKSKLDKMSRKERKAYEAKLRLQQQAQQQKQQKKKTETPKQETITAEPVKEQPKPEVVQSHKETVQGGPNKWRENGWDPNVRSDIFYSKFGDNLSDNSKRDVFVTDSLANRWAKQIRGEGREGSLADAVITDALSRADARHNLSNYDEASRGFYNDIKKNIASGNMPGTAVTFGPKYKNNIRTNRDTPTLVIPLSERPNPDYPPRIWADEQDGADLYELVFRPKADDILNSLNPDYWLYNNR